MNHPLQISNIKEVKPKVKHGKKRENSREKTSNNAAAMKQ
jgi:hypothetical protein